MHLLLWLGLALLALWVAAWLFFEVVGAAVHLLLIAGCDAALAQLGAERRQRRAGEPT